MITEYEPESDVVKGEELEDLDYDEPPEVEEGDIEAEDLEYEAPDRTLLLREPKGAEAEEKEEENADEPKPEPELVVPYTPYTRETIANIPSEKPYTHETIADVRELHFHPEPVIIQPRMDKDKRSNANNLIS